jgi:phosphate-selective porin
LGLPQRLNAGLAANDRLKYYLTLLQAAKTRAQQPHQEVPDLRSEREASGIADSAFDDIVAASHLDSDGRIRIPGAQRIRGLLLDALREMLEPLRVAATVGISTRTPIDAYASRLDALTAHLLPLVDDRLLPANIDALTRLGDGDRDSVHQLVIDLHRELNQLQASVFQDSVDGAKTYGLTDADRVLVGAFMKGVNSTAALKFDHPGLGTTATRTGDRLSVQNDLGTTDAHVVVIHVRDATATVMYTDIHPRRVGFFQDMLHDCGVTWESAERQPGANYARRVRGHGSDMHACAPEHVIPLTTEVALAAALCLLGPAVPATPQVGLEGGRVIRADLHITTQLEWRGSRPPPDGSTLDVRRARIGLKGALFGHVEYEVERDFREHDYPWRDAYVNVAFDRALEFRGGRFKVPFGLEQLAAARELDLLDRSLAAQYLTPGRDIGVMAHGRLLARRVRFQAAIFRAGGDNLRAAERRDPRRGALVAGRVVFRPWNRSDDSAGLLRTLSIGAAATGGRVPDGPYSVRARTAADDLPLFPAVTVRGWRRRYGGEIEWRVGPALVAGELMRVVDQRLGLSTDDGPLPDLIAQGWYVRGSWVLTGERKTERVRPARPFPGGMGALEVVGRLEDIGLRSRGTRDQSAPDVYADVLPARGNRAAAVGVNWYMTRYLKLQMNVARDWGRQRDTPVEQRRRWIPAIGVQFAL